jgi:mitogen-activated protein kinase 15
MTAAQALEHRYLADLHNPSKEPVREAPIRAMINDNKKFTIKEYREKVY